MYFICSLQFLLHILICPIFLFFVLDYGDGDIGLICEHYKTVLTSAGVCVDEILTEWTLLKREIFDR